MKQLFSMVLIVFLAGGIIAAQSAPPATAPQGDSKTIDAETVKQLQVLQLQIQAMQAQMDALTLKWMAENGLKPSEYQVDYRSYTATKVPQKAVEPAPAKK
jgi:hypothetical protein